MGKQVVKLLPQCSNLSSYKLDSIYAYNELKSMIEEFMIQQPKRLKPLKVIVYHHLDLDKVVELEEMLKNQSDLTSQLQFTFKYVKLNYQGGY